MRFRSIIGAFCFICLALFLALVIFVQTKTFGKVATKVITDLSQKRAQTQVSIKSIAISMFPPGIELNQVKVKKVFRVGKTLDAEFGKLGFYIGLIEFEERMLTLGEVRVSDSLINYYSDEPPMTEIDPAIINKVFDLSKSLPVRIDTVLLENSKLLVNHDILEAKRLKIIKRSDSFMARFHLANFQPTENSDITIDEIWGDAEIGRKDVDLHRVKIQHDVQSLLLKGKIKDYYKLGKADANVSGEASIHIDNLKDDIKLPEMIKLNGGFSHLSFKASVKNQKLNGSFDISVQDLDSNLVKADKIFASLELTNDILKLSHLTLSHKAEKVKLIQPRLVADFKNKRYLFQPLNLNAENLSLSNILRFMPSLKSIKGDLTGDLTFIYENENMEFRPKDGFLVHNLGLVVGDDKPFKVVMIKKAKFTASSFKVVNKEFRMDSTIQLKDSLLNVHGKVNSKLVDFKIHDAIVDLEDFGNISNLDVKGKGNINLDVSGPLDDVVLHLTGKTKGFEILGYKLGQTDKDISIALRDSNVVIHRFEAQYRSTPISGTGAVNYGNLDIALGINSPKTNFEDLKEIMTPVFSKLSFFPPDFDFNGKVDANIYGKTTMDQLKIKAESQFTDVIAYGETLNSGELTITMANQILSIRDFHAKKSKGDIRGDYSFNLKDRKMKLNFDWDELTLSSFSFAKAAKLNLNGLISGSITGEGTTTDYLFKVDGKMEDTKSQDHTFADSKFDVDISTHYLKGKIALLGNVIQSEFDYALNPSRASKISLNVNAPNIKPVATAVLGQHLESEEFSGSLKFNLDTSFRGKFEQVDLKAAFESIAFKHETFNVDYRSTSPQFIIEDNQIKKWSLLIEENDLFVKTKGQGTFGQQVLISNEINFNSKILELLLSPVLSSEGFIRNIVKVQGADKNYDFSVSSSSSELNMTLDSVPFPLNNMSYALELADKRIVIKELKASLENGSIGLKGDIFFDDKNPDINIKYYLDKAEIPILGKSLINLSGEGIILGNQPPYSIGGEILVNKAQIVNELSDFSSKSNALSQIRFLPPSQESAVGKLVNLNVNVKVETPIRLSNSLMDISLLGEVTLSGSPTRPRGDGALRAPPNSSRVFFKNNEYFINKAIITFSPKKEITNPDFDVEALTYISTYKVSAKAYGDLERFNFDLTSEPSLSRNSILSLIAFGYSDEIQNTLSQGQQQNLTQVGVGSFVFDRFKISDILNKQFGLQVNLGTLIEQSPTDSLLSGRSQEGQGGSLGRTRSATKIELKKRLDEALTLSVSSTMGGSIGQRQSMNLNYGVSKKVQLEGVYELRTNADGEEDIIDNSIGGDLKFRWTFK